jgi:hypothetical protein
VGSGAPPRQLNRLARHGWVVFHDLAIPDSRANADHLAIGPAGVFLIDSKNWRGHLVFAPDGTLWHGSYPLTATLATIGFEARAITGALAVPRPGGRGPAGGSWQHHPPGASSTSAGSRSCPLAGWPPPCSRFHRC